ncbi:MAG: PspA/IM30 family protein [Acidimicrobiales bacterium]|jgi:phage shock protein A
MGLFQRFLNIFRAKANRVLDRAEDPRDTLDLSYEKQLENLQKVRRGVAEVATARKRIEIQAAQLQQQGSKLQDQARQALGQNREDLAREALTRRAAIGQELTDLQGQHEQIAAQEQKLIATAQHLQAQVAAFRTKKETLKASYTAAEAQTRIGEATAGISSSMNDAGMTMQRAQDKIAEMQARAGAVDELIASGALTDLTSSTDDIQAQLDKVASTSQVDNELAMLKGELAATGATPAGLPAAADNADSAPPPAPAPEAPATQSNDRSNDQEVTS